MILEMAAFDVAGTTVDDQGLVLKAFSIAFERTQPNQWSTNGEKWRQYAVETMGQSKIEVFTELLGNKEAAYQANVAFEEAYINEIAEQGVHPISGTVELFEKVRERGIPIVLTTGFSRSTLNVLLTELSWFDLIDISVTPDEAGRGRPHPDMLKYAAEKLNSPSPYYSLVVGDTASDMKAGIAFGSNNVVGVLSGAHRENLLIEGGATSVVNSVADLISLL